MSKKKYDPMEQWYERKSSLMAEMLGKEHNVVMHALIPYYIGGSLDLYYYAKGIPGTAVATKELSEVSGEGSSNRVFKNYEFVMFTKRRLNLKAAERESTPFGKVLSTMNAILNCLAPYSAEAKLNPGDTCEFPVDMEELGGRCLIFDGYPTYSKKKAEFGLMAIIEIFRSEMEFARKHTGAELLARLREEGFYPYTDLDREAVA